MSNRYEKYSQVLNLVNYFKPCKMPVEVYLAGLAVSGLDVFCIPLTSEKLRWFVLVVTPAVRLPMLKLKKIVLYFLKDRNFLSRIKKFAEIFS